MREEDRRADEAARADDDLRPVAREYERPLKDPDRQRTGKSQQGHQGTRAREGAGANKADGVALLGHDPSIELVAVPHVEELGVGPRPPNFVGNSQGRIQMTARATASEQVLHFNAIVSTIRRLLRRDRSRRQRFINVSNLI